ncbi:hypothetical protein U1Q18_001043, partial [Sarracenia purpurea var. burkii]
QEFISELTLFTEQNDEHREHGWNVDELQLLRRGNKVCNCEVDRGVENFKSL